MAHIAQREAAAVVAEGERLMWSLHSQRLGRQPVLASVAAPPILAEGCLVGDTQ
jgi:hypothetical protein